jgi:hypothetical protein
VGVPTHAQADLDEIGRQRVAILGVVLERRDEHPVAGPDPEDASIAQTREKGPDDRAEGARVRELDRMGGRLQLRHVPE